MGKYRLLLLLMLLLLSSCAQGGPTPPTATPANVLNPPATAGTAGMKGRALNLDGTPWADTEIRLAEIYRNPDMGPKEGAFVLNESQSPGTRTDAQGNFSLQNVPARDYVLVVGDVNNKYKVILDETDYTRVFTLVSDQVLDVGEIRVDINTP